LLFDSPVHGAATAKNNDGQETSGTQAPPQNDKLVRNTMLSRDARHQNTSKIDCSKFKSKFLDQQRQIRT
jgi:hypothetical protein